MGLRLNLGAGRFPLDGYTNVDADPRCEPDVCMRVPPLHFGDGEAAEIYCGHLLEHLRPEDGAALLAECYRVLRPGGTLGVVVPDTAEIVRRYLTSTELGWDALVECPANRYWSLRDLDDVCAVFLFSTYQDSPHQWAYDARTLRRAVEAAGFQVTGSIDPYQDSRLVPAWWNLGVEAVRP